LTALVARRLAVVGAGDAFHRALRARCGLAPSHAAPGVRPGLAYCGREFRVYSSMRIFDAIRFYSALNQTWNAETLAGDLRAAGLDERFEVKRMKSAYQRALVLAFALAAEPHALVVEYGQEFDQPPALALLERAVARVPRTLVTYAAASEPPHFFEAAVPAEGFDPAEFEAA
jgi:hypothetical protein